MSASTHSILLSFKVASVATLGVVIVGTALAYLLARRRFLGRSVLDVVVTLPLVLQPPVTGYYLIVLFGRNGWIGEPLYRLTGWSLMFTWQAAALAAFVVALPLMVKTARAALEAVDERYLKAAYVLGYSEAATVRRVLLPLARRGLMAGAVLAFARALGEFGATLMVVRELGIPVLLVTHDLVESLTLADHLAVVRLGRVVQAGPPAELLAAPADDYVAALLSLENLRVMPRPDRRPDR